MDVDTRLASCHEIIPGLWVGNQAAAADADLARNWTLVINCTRNLPNYHAGLRYHRVPVHDPGSADTQDSEGRREVQRLRRLLPTVAGLIHRELCGGGRVLVHCHAGKQRSCAVVVYYLMRYRTPEDWPDWWRYEGAVGLLIRRRPVAFYGGESINFCRALYP
jgi:hypothetical protein